jgi:GT2 family glycosyltransferase
MNTVILVPRREGFQDRDQTWQWCRKWWGHEFPQFTIYEGHHEVGLFNRSAALNTAAGMAGDWDMALVIDSDVVAHPQKIRDALEQAQASGYVVYPFDVRYNLNPRGSQKIMSGFTGNWKPYIARTYHEQHSSVFAITRALWDAAGGFDEGFSGWGLEDTAFAMACEVAGGGRGINLSGEVWHLHHASAPGQKHGSPSHRANMARKQLYEEAYQQGDLARIHALVAEGKKLEAARTADRIPTTLHRVVPEHTPDVAEQWWQQFADLHPGWRMMTHRDPLDPAEWPISSPHWSRCKGGAQLADLVRLEALLRWGGIYVDMDVQPYRSLEPLLPLSAFAAWEDDKVVPNAVLGARPGHPAIRECLTEAIKIMHKGIWAAGPGVTTRVLTADPTVLLLPPQTFYAVHYNDPERDTKMLAKPSPWEYARHMYWGSWLPEARRRVPA